MFYSRTGIVNLVFLAMLGGTGCVSAWWNSFLNPSELGNFRENTVNEIQRSITFRDKPQGVPGAVDPTPDDLIATIEEYKIGPGDRLVIIMLDYLRYDEETNWVRTVDELGYIDIPQLPNPIHIEEMTTREVQLELIDQAKKAGIYSPEVNPTITVEVDPTMQLQRMYNISGAIPAPGMYPIVRPDFRLREAVNRAGGLGEEVKWVYVSRDEPRQTRIRETPSPLSIEDSVQGDIPAPPVTPMTISEMAGAPNPAVNHAAPEPQPTTRSQADSDSSLTVEEAEKDLLEALSPGRPEQTPSAPPAEEQEPALPDLEEGTKLPPFIYVNDSFIEAKPAVTQEAKPAESSRPAATTVPAVPPEQESVDWEEVASEDQQRILRIPADRLRQGDSNYNIVVKAEDWIRIDPGPVGLYYVLGHVMRSGPYALTGQEITLTQVIAAAGGLDPLAWPTRCEIRRRIDDDREETTQWDLARIIEGKDPDLFIKPNDVINVGTHAIAPLLLAIRNSFRLTYGFGFVYDRNFADIDSIGGQQNPTARRRVERQQRFPGLFP